MTPDRAVSLALLAGIGVIVASLVVLRHRPNPAVAARLAAIPKEPLPCEHELNDGWRSNGRVRFLCVRCLKPLPVRDCCFSLPARPHEASCRLSVFASRMAFPVTGQFDAEGDRL